MKKKLLSAVCLSLLATAASAAAPTTPVPSRGSALPSGANSDQVSWQHFVNIVAPVSATQAQFETWASDLDIYTTTPKWPSAAEAAEKKMQPGQLQRTRAPHASRVAGTIDDASCATVGDAAAGNFPVAKIPPTPPVTGATIAQPCYAEEVRRNRPSFDYIVGNKLNTQAGLAQAYQKATTSTWRISLPTDAIEVKADWLPMATLIKWLGDNGVTMTPEQVNSKYYTTTSKGQQYALVSMHVSSKEIPNWVWASFEHESNPGRCDTMGCFDSFGATIPAVKPVAKANGQYGSCSKSAALTKLFAGAKLPAAWNNYCLKSSQIKFVAKSGAPLMLGDSFTERIAASVPINQSSCIACHASAAINKDGSPFTKLLGQSPMGKVTLPGDVVAVDFIWGILSAPPPAAKP